MAKAPPDDAPILTSVSWEDRSWWSGQLNRQSALDYFSHSQFYDRTCLNQVLKMQVALTPQAVLEKLARLPGTVYELDESKTQEVPPTDGEPAHTLYAIRKLHRAPGRGVEPGAESTLRYYYILDGVVFEAPTLAAVMRARLLKLSWHLQQAFDLVDPAAAREKSSKAGGEGESSSGGAGGSKKRARQCEEPPG